MQNEVIKKNPEGRTLWLDPKFINSDSCKEDSKLMKRRIGQRSKTFHSFLPWRWKKNYEKKFLNFLFSPWFIIFFFFFKTGQFLFVKQLITNDICLQNLFLVRFWNSRTTPIKICLRRVNIRRSKEKKMSEKFCMILKIAHREKSRLKIAHTVSTS